MGYPDTLDDRLIDIICAQCPYRKRGCFYDHGDSITKIPCEAFLEICKIIFKAEETEKILEEINAELKSSTQPTESLQTRIKEALNNIRLIKNPNPKRRKNK